MNLWEKVGKYVNTIYLGFFISGIILFIMLWIFRLLSLHLIFLSFPVAAGITAAYLWIRLDVWHTDDTIKKMSVPNQDVADDLKSRRADSRVALTLLALIAIIQAFLPELKQNWLVLIATLLIVLPLSNCIARWMEKRHK